MISDNSSEKSLPKVTTRITTIGSYFIRIGVIVASLTSVYLIFLTATLQLGLTGFTAIFLLLICMIVTNLGMIIYIYGAYKSNMLNKVLIIQFLKNPKIHVVISLILANWSLIFIPTVYFIPFLVQPISYQRSYIFTDVLGYQLNLFSLLENYLHPANFLRFLGLIFVVFTIFILTNQIIFIFKRRDDVTTKYSLKLYCLELIFIGGILVLLIYETLSPVWDVLFPRAIISPKIIQEPPIQIDVTITPYLTLFFLIFLLCGSFRHDYFVIHNHDFLIQLKEKYFSKIQKR